MKEQNHNYCIILCGGVGSRLWPYSLSKKPKQFLDIFGLGYTMLQLTYKRFESFIPKEHIFISSYRKYIDLIHQQLPNVPDKNIIDEPVQLGTAPSAALTAAIIYTNDKNANVITSPADQMIVGEEDFRKQVLEGLDFVGKSSNFVAMGVPPTHPETSYGYIQAGNDKIGNFAHVKSFTEKPSAQFAQLFCDSGEFYWSTGLFLWGVKTFINNLSEKHPGMSRFIKLVNEGKSSKELHECVEELFPRNVYEALDMAILEHKENVFVQPCTFSWADVGSWDNLYNIAQKDNQGNVCLDSRAELYDCHNNIISLPQGRLLLAKGMKDYIISENDRVLVICPKNDPALLRRMMTDAQIKYE